MQKVHIVLEDDIDGGEASETVTFALDGTAYEIDLSDTNAEKLRETMAGFVGFARKVGHSGKRRAAKATQLGPTAREIRDWARSNKHDVPDRGRIPDTVRQAFDLAHAS